MTALSPTRFGEGKTCTSVGLADGLCQIGKNAMVALREPSLGPVFGVKGGAAGGGYAQVVPMQDINLHFTGDLHAISCAHNLLSAMVDNHLHWAKEPQIDVNRVEWRRVVDMNDRALRNITCGLGARTDGIPRSDGFDITVASEVMAIFCLADSLEDLKRRLSQMVVGKFFPSLRSRTFTTPSLHPPLPIVDMDNAICLIPDIYACKNSVFRARQDVYPMTHLHHTPTFLPFKSTSYRLHAQKRRRNGR